MRRGVYKARWTLNGNRVLYAIKSNGDRHKVIVELRPGVSEPRAWVWLAKLLDRIDPPLRLIKPPPKPKPLTMEQLEALYRDSDPIRRLTWQRKLAKARGGTFG